MLPEGALCTAVVLAGLSDTHPWLLKPKPLKQWPLRFQPLATPMAVCRLHSCLGKMFDLLNSKYGISCYTPAAPHQENR